MSAQRTTRRGCPAQGRHDESRRGAAVTPHVVVGIFIVNNNPETMTLRFLQPTVCILVVSSVDFAFRAGASALPDFSVRSYQVAPRILFCSRKKIRRRSLHRSAKNPAQSSRPGSSRSFGEYALLEDSRYMSQEASCGDLNQPENIRYFRGLLRVHDVKPEQPSLTFDGAVPRAVVDFFYRMEPRGRPRGHQGAGP
jgi:hypothetical protein